MLSHILRHRHKLAALAPEEAMRLVLGELPHFRMDALHRPDKFTAKAKDLISVVRTASKVALPAHTRTLRPLLQSLYMTSVSALEQRGIDEPEQSAKRLLAFAFLGSSHSRDYSYMSGCLAQGPLHRAPPSLGDLPQPVRDAVARFDALLERRLDEEPLQYLVHDWDFHSVTLAMSKPVLIPRPETEHLVNLVLADVRKRRPQAFALPPQPWSTVHPPQLSYLSATAPSEQCVGPSDMIACFPRSGGGVVGADPPASSSSSSSSLLRVGHGDFAFLDLCSGTGCISLALLHSMPSAFGFAVDVLPDAMDVLLESSQQEDWPFRLALARGDVRKVRFASRRKFDLIVSNPPYVPTQQVAGLERTVREYESHLALDGGGDGLDVVRAVLQRGADWLCAGGKLWLEVDGSHPEAVARLAPAVTQKRLQYVASHRDQFGIERFCELECVG